MNQISEAGSPASLGAREEVTGSKAETYDDIIRRLMREAGYLDEQDNLVKRT